VIHPHEGSTIMAILKKGLLSAPSGRAAGFGLVMVTVMVVADTSGARGQITDLTGTALPQWHLVEDLRIGSLDGLTDSFVLPVSVLQAPDGEIIVLDIQIPAIMVYGPDGSFRRQIGTPGEGPGQYLSPIAAGIADGALWLVDQRLSRLTVYKFDGTVQSTKSIPTRSAVMAERIQPVAPHADGYYAITPRGPDFTRYRTPERVSFEQSLVRLSSELAVLDTVASYRSETGMIALGGGSVWFFDPIPSRSLALYDIAFTFFASVLRPEPIARGPARFAVRTSRLPADSLRWDRVAEFTDRSVSVPDAVMDSLRLLADSSLTRLRPTASATERRALLQLARVPMQEPPVSSASIATNGMFWLLRERFRPDPHWVVLDANLLPVARVVTPAPILTAVGAGLPILLITNEFVWITERGDYDVPYVVRYRIQR